MKKHIISGLLVLSVLVPVSVFAELTGDVDPNGPVSTCVSLNNNLRYQSRDISTNGEVSTLQDFLQYKGYLNSEPTGYFGLLTFAAAKSFQSANGIAPTGYVGPITRAKISLLTCNGLIPVSPNGSSCPFVEVNGSITHVCFPGCSSDQGFSSTTGKPCEGTSTTDPCSKGAIYSSENGKPCTTTTNPYLPPGCTSTSGYSSENGKPCGTNLQLPIITFTATPSTITAGESTMLKWSTVNATSCVGSTQAIEQATIGGSQLIYPSSTTTYTITCSNANLSKVSKSVTVTVVPLNSYCSASGFNDNGLRCGCSTVSGWSSTTGLSCNILSEVPVISHLQLAGCTSNIGSTHEDDSCAAVGVGGTVYIFGSNFISDSEVWIGDGRQIVNPTFISSTALSFVTPYIPGSNTSISVKVELGGKNYFSNNVNLPLE